MTDRPPSRVVALYCVYNDDRWLPYSLQGVYPCVDQIYFFLSSNPWFGQPQGENTSLSKVRALPDPENKMQVIEGAWKDEVEQRNFTLALAQHDGATHALIVDADEIYESAVLKRMIHHGLSRPEVDCWHIRWLTYWKSHEFRIDPAESYAPTFLVKLGSGGFVEWRNFFALDLKKHSVIPPEVGICHHMSYARTDAEVLQKTTTWGHASQVQGDWFQKIWKGWDVNNELENLHPVDPPLYHKAIRQPVHLLPSQLHGLA